MKKNIAKHDYKENAFYWSIIRDRSINTGCIGAIDVDYPRIGIVTQIYINARSQRGFEIVVPNFTIGNCKRRKTSTTMLLGSCPEQPLAMQKHSGHTTARHCMELCQ